MSQIARLVVGSLRLLPFLPLLFLLVMFSPRLSLGQDSPASKAEGEEKPNIVLIFVDDMGYGDATSYNPDAYVETPAIDKLAEGGVRFTNGYVTGPVCYPSRVGIMTGAYQARFGCY
ncbi:MAG: sulfatase-like hydrolase/transferase, partial [Opitutales bacterium]